MSQCRVCNSPDRLRIELALVAPGGDRLQRATARKFGFSPASVQRHWAHHVSEARKVMLVAGPLKLHELADRAAEMGLSQLQYAEVRRGVLMQLFLAAAEAKDLYGAATISGRLSEVDNFIQRIKEPMQRITNHTTNNLLVLQSAPWMDVQAMLTRILTPNPPLLEEVARGFEELSQRYLQQQQATGTQLIEAARG